MNFAIIGSRGFPSTYGGYETLVRYLARHLVAEGHGVTVYCRTMKDGQREWWHEGVKCVATRGKDSKSLSTLSFGATSISNAARTRYDAALVLNIANGYWLPMLRAARVPFAVNTDGLEWRRDKWSTMGKAVFKGGALLSARLAPELVCDSQALSRIWLDEFGRDSTFIPYGGEPTGDLGTERITEFGLRRRGYALAVARLVPENNVELLLDALEQLGDRAPKTVIVGSANFENPITERLRRLQDAGRVLWLGHVSDQGLLAELWHHAGVYVHGHSVGGTNPALLQALASGAPTVALDTVFNREVLVDDRFLFPHDAGALAARVAALTAGPVAEHDDLVRSGSAIVAERYTWPDVCARYTELLLQLAAVRSRARVRAAV